MDSHTEGCIVLDHGEHTIKAGWKGDESTLVSIHSAVGRPRHRGVSASFGVDSVLFGADAQAQREILSLKSPIRRGVVQDGCWEDMEKLWHHIFGKLNANTTEQSVVFTEPTLNAARHSEQTVQVLFETFAFPKVACMNSCLLALGVAGRSAALVVDIGEGVCQSVPIYDGFAVSTGMRRQDLGGADVNDVLTRLLSQNGYSFPGNSGAETVRDIKEKLCHVASSPDHISSTEYTYPIDGGQEIRFSGESYRAPEVLFNPSKHGYRSCLGVHNFVYESLMGCGIDIRDDLYSAVLVSGGSCQFKGFEERLKAELECLLPATKKISILQTGKYSIWNGAAMVSEASFIQKDEYDEYGPPVVHKRGI